MLSWQLWTTAAYWRSPGVGTRGETRPTVSSRPAACTRFHGTDPDPTEFWRETLCWSHTQVFREGNQPPPAPGPPLSACLQTTEKDIQTHARLPAPPPPLRPHGHRTVLSNEASRKAACLAVGPRGGGVDLDESHDIEPKGWSNGGLETPGPPDPRPDSLCYSG